MKDLEQEVRKILRKKMWLVLSTVDGDNQSHSSVVVYQSDGNVLYVSTGKKTFKVIVKYQSRFRLGKIFSIKLFLLPLQNCISLERRNLFQETTKKQEKYLQNS